MYLYLYGDVDGGSSQLEVGVVWGLRYYRPRLVGHVGIAILRQEE